MGADDGEKRKPLQNGPFAGSVPKLSPSLAIMTLRADWESRRLGGGATFRGRAKRNTSPFNPRTYDGRQRTYDVGS